MEDLFGLKELYDVHIKATYPLEIGKKTYEINETILNFDKVQLSTLSEGTKRYSTSGGRNNEELIYWENTTEVQFALSRGVISKTGFALLSNSPLDINEINETVSVGLREELESSEEGKITLKYAPILDNTFFLYNKLTAERITEFTIVDKIVTIANLLLDVVVDYTFEYKNGFETLRMGPKVLRGYLKLTGKMRLRDDVDGHYKTGILEIPKIRLMSDLSMRLGDGVEPLVSNFYIVGYPVDEKKERTVCRIIFLDSQIDGDF